MDLADLYATRLLFDKKRQPSREDLLDAFDLQLEGLGKEHPYELEWQDRKKFGQVLLGSRANAHNLGKLYRLQGLKSLVQRTDSIVPLSTRPAEEIFQTMILDHKRALGINPKSGGWLRLGKYVTGK